mmetsp:Transcript_25950/g.29686  ORF Transcript_25950/g.29686 Transcript_25950/m.29686 type:complete len:126 (+) Transcript_25950:155-532(+)
MGIRVACEDFIEELGKMLVIQESVTRRSNSTDSFAAVSQQYIDHDDIIKTLRNGMDNTEDIAERACEILKQDGIDLDAKNRPRRRQKRSKKPKKKHVWTSEQEEAQEKLFSQSKNDMSSALSETT